MSENNQKHTPEPWRYQAEKSIIPAITELHHETSVTIFQIYTSSGPYGNPASCEKEEDAVRIVACINACEGITPAAVPLMLKALKLASLRQHAPDDFGPCQCSQCFFAAAAAEALAVNEAGTPF